MNAHENSRNKTIKTQFYKRLVTDGKQKSECLGTNNPKAGIQIS
jgi:hypothetical protein